MRSTAIKWPAHMKQARRVQEALFEKVTIVPLRKEPSYIAGVDSAFFDDSVVSAACLYNYPDLELVERAYALAKVEFPYVPGFLSFREGPSVIGAIGKLKTAPDLIFFDGQGIAHPRKMGIASHIGVLLDIPAIGCAKSRLVGEFSDPGIEKGSLSALRYRGEQVGVVLRTRKKVKPVFLSPGHRIDFEDSTRITLSCINKFRLPEPIRCADSFSRNLRKELQR